MSNNPKKQFLADVDLRNSNLIHGGLSDISIEFIEYALQYNTDELRKDLREGYLVFDTTFKRFGTIVKVGDVKKWYWSEEYVDKNTAWNKNFGDTEGTVAEGNDKRILRAEEVWEWWSGKDINGNPIEGVTPGKDIVRNSDSHISNNDIHVTKSQKDQWDQNTVYSNENPLIESHGGLTEGTTFDKVPLNELITQILYRELPPEITSWSSSLSNGYYKSGVKTKVTINIKKKSNPPTSALIRLNNKVVGIVALSGTDESVSTDITLTESGDLKVYITDGVFTEVTSDIKYHYDIVNPVYYNVYNEDTVVTSISSLSGFIEILNNKEAKGSVSNLNKNKVAILIPMTYELDKIVDSSGLNITNSFDTNSVQFDGVQYMICLSNTIGLDKFEFTVKFK